MELELPSVEIFRDILGVSPSADGYWSIEKTDKNRDLYLCHYDSSKIPEILRDPSLSDSDRKAILKMRGLIVSLAVAGKTKGGVIVTRGYEYTPLCTVSGDLQSSKLELKDSNGFVKSFDLSSPNTSVAFNHEGTVVRISKIEGKVLMSTAHNLKIENSFWGDSPTFSKIYSDFGGPDPETLFDSSKPNSNITHLFMLVHPSLQIATRLNVGSGYIAYLGYSFNNEISEIDPQWFETEVTRIPQNMESVDYRDPTGKIIVPIRNPSDILINGKPNLFSPYRVSGNDGFEVAKLILKIGVSNQEPTIFDGVNPLHTPGEACIVRYTDEQGNEQTVKLASVAYNWRGAVNSNNPNRYNQFVSWRSLILKRYLEEKRNIESIFIPSSGRTSNFQVEDLVEIFNGTPERMYSYEQLFPHIAYPSEEQLTEFGRRYEDYEQLPTIIEMMSMNFNDYKVDERDEASFRESRMANIAANFILAVSEFKFIDSCSYLYRLKTDISTTISIMCHKFNEFKTLVKNFNEYMKGSKTLMERSLLGIPAFRKSIKVQGIEQRVELNTAGKVVVRMFNTIMNTMSDPAITKQILRSKVPYRHGDESRILYEASLNSLRNLVQKEYGPTLYSLIVGVKAYTTRGQVVGMPESASPKVSSPSTA